MSASASGIKAGRAYVSLGADSGPLQAAMKRAEARVKLFGQTMAGIGSKFKGLGLAAASIGGAALAPFGLAIKRAGDLAETASKLDATFKGNSADVKDWAKSFAKEVGRSQGQMQNFAADTGAVLNGLDLDPTKAAEMSKAVSGLAVDLGSFFNVKDDDALRSLISGLTGESEPLKKFGLIVQETQTKAELLNQGIDPSKATEAQKVFARYNLILKGTRDAQGDAVRTAGSFNNQMKALEGTADDVAVTIGEALLPVVGPLVGRLRHVAVIIGKLVSNNAGLIVTVAEVAAGVAVAGVAVYALGTAFGVVGAVVGGVGTAIGALSAIITFVLSPFGLIVAAAAGAGVAFLTLSKTGRGAMATLKSDVSASMTGMANALKSGDLALAAQILWATLKLEWVKGVNFLNLIWQDWGVAFQAVFSDASFAIARGWVELTTSMRLVWRGLTDYFSLSWGNVVEKLIVLTAPFLALLAKIAGIDIGDSIDRALAAVNVGKGPAGDRGFFEKDPIEEDRKEQLRSLDDQQRAADADRLGASRASVAAGAKGLADAQAELAGLLGKAEAGAGGEAGKGGGSLLQGISGALGSVLKSVDAGAIAAGLGRAAKGVEAVGTFDASTVGQIGPSNLSGVEGRLDQLTDVARDIKRNTRNGNAVYVT